MQIPKKKATESIKNAQTKEAKKVRLLPDRDVVHTGPYFEESKPRGREGGYSRALRSVRDLQSDKEKNRLRNEKGKRKAKERTQQRKQKKESIFKQALERLAMVSK